MVFSVAGVGRQKAVRDPPTDSVWRKGCNSALGGLFKNTFAWVDDFCLKYDMAIRTKQWTFDWTRGRDETGWGKCNENGTPRISSGARERFSLGRTTFHFPKIQFPPFNQAIHILYEIKFRLWLLFFFYVNYYLSLLACFSAYPGPYRTRWRGETGVGSTPHGINKSLRRPRLRIPSR